MIDILKSRYIAESKKRIEHIVKTVEGVFLIKTCVYEDLSAQTRVYNISFNEIGEMICESNGGITINSCMSIQDIKSFHFASTNKIYSDVLLELLDI